MSAVIDNYRKTVEQPWGRMFYDLIYRQLNIPSDKKLKILDFGAGFCITAGHYAKSHEVTAVEPSEEMYNLRFSDNYYTLVPQGAEYLETLEDNSYDIKFTDEWYEAMLDLETEAGKKEEYKKIAFFNHLIFKKK